MRGCRRSKANGPPASRQTKQTYSISINRSHAAVFEMITTLRHLLHISVRVRLTAFYVVQQLYGTASVRKEAVFEVKLTPLYSINPMIRAFTIRSLVTFNIQHNTWTYRIGCDDCCIRQGRGDFAVLTERTYRVSDGFVDDFQTLNFHKLTQ